MAFKLKPNPTFVAPAQISQAGSDEMLSIPFEFLYLSRSAYKEQIEDAKLKVIDAVRLVVRGWQLEDDPWSQERFEEFLDDYPIADQEIWTAYTREMSVSKRKN